MRAILGIDPAWTNHQPSGVALIQGEEERWSVVCVAPSYEAFIACSQGSSLDWGASKFTGSWPNVNRLIDAARKMISDDAELSVVAVDIPVATVRFESRRLADDAISRAFGGRGCSTHSPSSDRPGLLGRDLMDQLTANGFPLATKALPTDVTRCTLEVYPHPALLSLLHCDYRVSYKVSSSNRYWPNSPRAERIANLLQQFRRINQALGRVFSGAALSIPREEDVTTLSRLKRYEDALDALVCAWVGLRFANGAAVPYGDESASIWVPEA